ncbi:hypothetical protein [Methylobacterium komagatae]
MSERKIVINKCFGGFGLSDAALYRYAERKGLTLYPEKGLCNTITYWTVPPERRPVTLEGEAFYAASMEERAASNDAHSANTLYHRDIPRDDPDLVSVVEDMGDAANGTYAKLKVISIPADAQWEIDDYDGSESIHEVHRTWA